MSRNSQKIVLKLSFCVRANNTENVYHTLTVITIIIIGMGINSIITVTIIGSIVASAIISGMIIIII